MARKGWRGKEVRTARKGRKGWRGKDSEVRTILQVFIRLFTSFPRKLPNRVGKSVADSGPLFF